MRNFALLGTIAGALSAPLAFAQEAATSAVQPSGALVEGQRIELVQVASGLSDPVGVASPPDGSGRVFVIERQGVVRVIEDGELREEPFLDISDDVLSAFLEQGLYDLAFHPDFAENGVFFVHFAELLRNGDSLVVRYRVSGDDPNRADPESARLVLQIGQPYANHNGGELAFGPDGYLYIGSGDGGWEGDPLEAGQDLSTLLGKVLRIDVAPALDDADPYRDYAIPPDNPFARDPEQVRLFGLSEEFFADIHTQARPEIWAYGLRNPWKFSFDPETGDLWLPDVGQNEWEEINLQPAGVEGGTNYGWDFLMGTHCFPVQEESCAEVGVLPVAEYSHDLGCAVIDIGVLRDPALEDLSGTYLAGDYCAGTIWGIVRAEDDGWRMGELLTTTLRITGSGRGDDGALYVTACDCHYGGTQNTAGGTVWRVMAASEVPEGATTAPARAEPYEPHQHDPGGGEDGGGEGGGDGHQHGEGEGASGQQGHHQDGGTGSEGSGDAASSEQSGGGQGQGTDPAEAQETTDASMQSDGAAADGSMTPEIVTEGATISGDTVTIHRVVAEQDGYVAIHAMVDGQPVAPGSIGHAAVSAGVNEHVEVTIDYPFAEGEDYMAMLHAETNGNDTYDFGPELTDVDTPVMVDGQPVVSTFSGS